MVENIQVRDGDMITMVKVVNENTKSLDSRISNLVNDCNRVFGLIGEDVTKVEKRVKINRKGIVRLGCVVLGLDIAILTLMARIKKLEKDVAKLQDEKLVNDFMKDEEDPDFLK